MPSKAAAIHSITSQLLSAQTSELTEFYIYSQLAEQLSGTDPKNSKVLLAIAHEEKAHAQFWQSYTKQEASPNQLKIVFIVM